MGASSSVGLSSSERDLQLGMSYFFLYHPGVTQVFQLYCTAAVVPSRTGLTSIHFFLLTIADLLVSECYHNISTVQGADAADEKCSILCVAFPHTDLRAGVDPTTSRPFMSISNLASALDYIQPDFYERRSRPTPSSRTSSECNCLGFHSAYFSEFVAFFSVL